MISPTDRQKQRTRPKHYHAAFAGGKDALGLYQQHSTPSTASMQLNKVKVVGAMELHGGRIKRGCLSVCIDDVYLQCLISNRLY